MTIDDKRILLQRMCSKYEACMDGCPLWGHIKGSSGKCHADATSEEIERNYEIMMEAEKMAVVRRRTTSDAINPSHYKQASVECIDVILETQGIEATKGFCLCNAMKYLYRHNAKNGDEDIKKAAWYLNKYLEIAEKKEAE
jgi:hypothetical protein